MSTSFLLKKRSAYDMIFLALDGRFGAYAYYFLKEESP